MNGDPVGVDPFRLAWLVAAFGLKKTKRSESRLSWAELYAAPLFLACALLVVPKTHRGWLGYPLVPLNAATEWFGATVTLAGLFA